MRGEHTPVQAHLQLIPVYDAVAIQVCCLEPAWSGPEQTASPMDSNRDQLFTAPGHEPVHIAHAVLAAGVCFWCGCWRSKGLPWHARFTSVVAEERVELHAAVQAAWRVRGLELAPTGRQRCLAAGALEQRSQLRGRRSPDAVAASPACSPCASSVGWAVQAYNSRLVCPTALSTAGCAAPPALLVGSCSEACCSAASTTGPSCSDEWMGVCRRQ